MYRSLPALKRSQRPGRLSPVEPFRAACVVTGEGTLAGVLTRTTLLDDVRRPVVLLDHNEASQAVPGIEEADVVEIIDHHRLGAITTLRPIRFSTIRWGRLRLSSP